MSKIAATTRRLRDAPAAHLASFVHDVVNQCQQFFALDVAVAVLSVTACKYTI